MGNYLGSCLCQKVKYEVEGVFSSFFLCHCKRCQKNTGSAHASNLFSTKANIKWLQGKEKVRNFKLPDTRHEKSFCADCGAALPSEQGEGLLVVPAGSLDSSIEMKPNAHIFCLSRANWDCELERTRSFDRLPC